MGWRERYQPASFRGVPFKVKRSDAEFGRRMALHEYPQRDEPYSEDLGRKARKFGIEAFVIGGDYDKARDALIDALEARGPGLLVHPYYGRRTVALAAPARVSESPSDEGGMARFALDFVEAGEALQPSARADTRSAVASAAEAARAAARADFTRRFTVARKPAWVDGAALDLARQATAALTQARAGFMPDLTVLVAYTAAARGVANSLGAMIRSPLDLANNLQDLFTGLSGVMRSPTDAVAAYRNLGGFGADLPAVAETTPARAQQAVNQAALVALMRRQAAIEAAQASAAIEFESYDQAVALRDDLGDRIDAVADDASESVYAAFVQLRVAMVQDITARGADLARVSRVALQATLPALLVAYRLYGDATRDGEIVSRNRRLVRHPGFVPGGVPLEILAGGNAG